MFYLKQMTISDFYFLPLLYFFFRSSDSFQSITPPKVLEEERCPRSQTHRVKTSTTEQPDPGVKKQVDRGMGGHGCCGCFSGSVLAGCCEEWERSNQQVYCRRNSSQWEALGPQPSRVREICTAENTWQDFQLDQTLKFHDVCCHLVTEHILPPSMPSFAHQTLQQFGKSIFLFVWF